MDAVLPRTGSPTDRAIAIVGYRRARNAAARRAHAQRRRRYCEYLFRRHQVSLHYYEQLMMFAFAPETSGEDDPARAALRQQMSAVRTMMALDFGLGMGR